MVFNWKILLVILVFSISVAPVLYAYYLQMELSSGQVVGNQETQSGIQSLFWEGIMKPFVRAGFSFGSFDFYFSKSFY